MAALEAKELSAFFLRAPFLHPTPPVSCLVPRVLKDSSQESGEVDLWLRVHMTFAEDLSSQPPVALGPRDPLVPVGTPTLTPIPTPTYLPTQTHSFKIFLKELFLRQRYLEQLGRPGALEGDTSWLWAWQGTQRPSNCLWVSCRDPARKRCPVGAGNPTVLILYTLCLPLPLCVLMINFDPCRHLMASLHSICIVVSIYLCTGRGDDSVSWQDKVRRLLISTRSP